MNSEMKNFRGQIDAVDTQLIELLRKRFELANSVIESKPSGQVVDQEREAVILRRYLTGLGNVSTPAKVEVLVRALLAASRAYPSTPAE